jgi:glc operon protein GlcG
MALRRLGVSSITPATANNGGNNSGEESMRRLVGPAFAICAALLLGAQAPAQQAAPTPPLPPTTPYGTPITLDQAKRAADAAEAESKKRNSTIAIAVVEPTGDLVYFRKMDGTQYGSIKTAQSKAISAALFRRASKTFRERVAQGDLSPMALDGAVASDGGVPIVVNGKIIGAIGISGGADDAIAQAGADALK